MAKQPVLRPRTEYHEPVIVPGLRHIGYDVFADAKPAGLQSHRHAGAFEVCWIRRGSLQWQVGERSFAVGPGDLFLTLPDELHGGRNGVMDRCELFWASFCLDRRGCGLAPAEGALLDRCLRTSRLRVCPGPDSIAGHFERMLAALGSPDPFTPAVVRSSLALLLAEVREAYLHAATGAVRRCSPRIERAKAWMAEHLAEPIALDAIAAEVGLRASQFRAVFRAETGFAPQEHLARLRVERAKDLLVTSDRSITRIALDTGFSTSQYFATAFRRLTGFTPRAWRKRR
jgi:AraC family L-rhamnose operon regulatory protein RhaS